MRQTKQLGLLAADDTRATAAKPFRHRSRLGVAYYLHRGTTKRGKPRYFFAKSIGDDIIGEMPAGYEVAESVNGVVTVRKATSASPIPPADLALVRAALDRDPLLRRCVVEAKAGAIIIHEPERGTVPRGDELAGVARELGVPLARLAAHYEATSKNARYTPIMMFEPAFVGDTGQYLASRRTYRGAGGWLALSHGPFAALVKKYVHHIARQSFFELM